MQTKIAYVAIVTALLIAVGSGVYVQTRSPGVERSMNISCWDGRPDGKPFLQLNAKDAERAGSVITVIDPQIQGALPGTTIEVIVGSAVTCALGSMPVVAAPVAVPPAPAPAPTPKAPSDAGPVEGAEAEAAAAAKAAKVLGGKK